MYQKWDKLDSLLHQKASCDVGDKFQIVVSTPDASSRIGSHFCAARETSEAAATALQNLS
jgi:hypothetical protein